MYLQLRNDSSARDLFSETSLTQLRVLFSKHTQI